MMDEKPSAMQALGLQIERETLKAAFFSFKQGQPRLEELYSIDIRAAKNGEGVNPLYMTEQGKKLSRLLKQQLSLSALSSSETLVRALQVKLKKEKDINDVLAFQAEPLLPYPADEANLDWIKAASLEEGALLTLFAAKRDHIASHLESWKPLGIDPEVVSTVPAAIAAFASRFAEEQAPFFVLHIGFHNATCAAISDGKLVASQFSPHGLHYLVQALVQDKEVEEEEVFRAFCGLDFENLSSEKESALISALETLRCDIMRNLVALGKSFKGEGGSSLLFTGEGGAISSLAAKLSQSLGKKVLKIAKFEECPADEGELLRFAVPIGLALSGLPKGPMKVNLRRGELAYPKPWKRIKKPLALYFSSCLLLAGAVLLCGNAYLGLQEDKLKDAYGSLLAFADKRYDEFEAEFQKKYPRDASDRNEIPSIDKLSGADLFARVEQLEKEISTAPEPIALLPNTPRVSDLLAWLSSHPNVLFSEVESNAKRPLVKVESINYTMVKRPEENKRGNRYQVKVEIEFSSPTPKLARELHDALIENNSFVDPKGEVKWSSSRGRYRTSFFLQDKTYYPTHANS